MNRTLFAVCLAACSGSAAQPPDTLEPVTFPDACPQMTCQTGPTVDGPVPLADFVNASASWTYRGEYTSGCLFSSGEVIAAIDISLAGDAVTIPSMCPAGSDCRQKVSFRLDPTATGVRCDDPEQFFDFTACGGITVTAGTALRVRAVLLDIHPSAFGNYMPLVDVLGGCAATCGADAFACAATDVCYGSVRDHCAYCLGGTNEQCACWNGSALEPDGTACEMFVSGDVMLAGTCRDGACVSQ
jgi:hypothetical protein